MVEATMLVCCHLCFLFVRVLACLFCNCSDESIDGIDVYFGVLEFVAVNRCRRREQMDAFCCGSRARRSVVGECQQL